MRIRTFSALLISVAIAAPSATFAADPGDFTVFASEHCDAMVKSGRADLGFTLGEARGKFSNVDLQEYSARFAQKLVADFGIDPTQPCVLDTVSVGAMDDYKASHKPNRNKRRDNLERNYNQAVVSGYIPGREGVPVAVSYRLQQEIGQSWEIKNISLNGQPVDDMYREQAEALAKEGGATAVIRAF